MKKKEEKGIDSRKSPPTLQEETHKIDKEGRAHTSVGIVPVRVLLSNDLRSGVAALMQILHCKGTFGVIQ